MCGLLVGGLRRRQQYVEAHARESRRRAVVGRRYDTASCGAFTLSLGLVSISRGRGWSFFGFRGRSRAGVTCRIRYEVQPVDDMERMSGPPYWLDLDECRYYISQRVAPDPETRKIWEHNEAEAAIVRSRRPVAFMRLVATSRCRGWSLFRVWGRSDGVDHTGGC